MFIKNINTYDLKKSSKEIGIHNTSQYAAATSIVKTISSIDGLEDEGQAAVFERIFAELTKNLDDENFPVTNLIEILDKCIKSG